MASDTKLQKLIDRTIENILTALIEVCGVILTEANISAESYPDVMRKIAGSSVIARRKKKPSQLFRSSETGSPTGISTSDGRLQGSLPRT